MVPYKDIIESRYNRQNWQLLLHDIFGNKVKFWNTPSPVATSSQFAKQALWLGTITLSDEQTISIYEVELADSVDIERNRRGIRDMLLTAWRNNGNAGAFMFCYRKNESVLRFSYVSESWTFADDGSYKKESTDTKRFTYLLGEGHRSRTAIQQFEKLRDSALSLKDLTKAFSVEAVGDMFFKGYKQQYEDIIFHVTGKRMVKVGGKWEERQEGKPNAFIMQQFARFANPEKAIRDYVKKLMGRLVFLQFLQKKGWLGVPVQGRWGEGDPEYIQTLFAQCNDKDHFVDHVLEPLFNDLNTEREGNLATPSLGGGRGRLIPYLNGGLFEREAADETEFPLPAKYMQSLLDFFASYNFTIDENDPDDAEVGVDPEMLGRIFENLLEDNKDKGAFYTPKEIVTYMCRESLIAYLQTDIKDEPTKEAIRQFVTTHDVNALGTNAKFRQQVDEALKEVKICDPAIGSGAFPMGLLKELFLCRTAIEGISQHQAAEIKKHIIQKNIYGVDIERGAVDIARLRFWLALIVDEETPQALPNLDFKIMQGNSLLEQYKSVDLSTMTEKKADESGMLSIFDNMLDVFRLDLRKMLDEYYNCTDHHKKQELRLRIIDNVKQQLREQSIDLDFGTLDLSGNDQFFLWHTWFYDVFSQGGFDIVIGNPPYGAKYSNTEKLLYKTIYKHQDYQPESYLFFLEKGLLLCQESGILSYIIPNTWLINLKLQKIRQFVLGEKALLSISHYHRAVFDAVVDTEVIMIKNISDEKNIVNVFRHIGRDCIIKLQHKQSKWKKLKGSPVNIFVTEETENIVSKIEKDSYELKELVNVYAGFVPYEVGKGNPPQTREMAKNKIYNSEYPIDHSYRKALRGSDIKKYTNLWHGTRWIKYGPNLAAPRKHEIFDSSKIVMRQTGDSIVATYDDQKFVCFKNMHVINAKNGTDLYYILGVLNSKLVNFYFRFLNPEVGEALAEVKKEVVEKLRIKLSDDMLPIISLVKNILTVRNNDVNSDISKQEIGIDLLVYHLYNLTYDEVLVVDPETPITRKEYEKGN